MSWKIKNQLVGLDPKFQYRGLNQTRVETFSDVGFALVITLIVLSASVPESFQELKESMKGIVPFFLCVILLVVIWVQHYLFFLRYGLQDIRTVVYNTLLLCLVLVYVYPLKFLMSFLVGFYSSIFTGIEFHLIGEFGEGDMKFLMILYGVGAGLIFITLALLYNHAFNKKDEPELSDYEVFLTRVSININLLLSSIPFLSSIIAAVRPNHGITYGLSGFSYMLYPIIMPLYGRYLDKKVTSLFAE